MIRLIFLALALSLLGTARAGCAVRPAQIQLPDYSALVVSTGTLLIPVRCDAPDEQAVLTLAGAYLRTDGADLLLTLHNGTDTLDLRVVDAAPLHSGLTLTGTQTLRFRLLLAPNQWVEVGSYSLMTTLLLTAPAR